MSTNILGNLRNLFLIRADTLKYGTSYSQRSITKITSLVIIGCLNIILYLPISVKIIFMTISISSEEQKQQVFCSITDASNLDGC